MSKLHQLSRRDLIRRLRKLGFEGPYRGPDHDYMARGDYVVRVPNPHCREIGVNLLSEILREEGISRAIIEADLVDCMVALPGQLFYSTQIPACLWFLARDKKNGRFRDRRGETLFIDARKMGVLIDRVHRELTEEDIAKIAGTYHVWRGDAGTGKYEDVPGFCKSATVEEIRKNGYVLTPGRYVGAEAAEEDDEPFEEKMQRLTEKLEEQFRESARLEAEMRANLKGLGYEI